MIDINNITVRIGSKVLLENASAHISDGWKVGLVGANGCGKSTLFKVLLGGMETEGGEVFFPSGYRVATVSQEQNDIDIHVIDFVLAADNERTELLQQLEAAADEDLAEIHERLNLLGASSAEARAASILNGLGFSNDDFHRPIKEFSGGWRMRLALAAALFQPSDILLLDEPTNHLDLEASIWLESHLQRYKGTLLLISHDKYVLNDLCNYIIHIENQTLNTYSGNYDTFRNTRTIKREVQARSLERQDAKRQHLQSFVDRFRYKASKAKQAQSRIKMLEKLETIAPLGSEYSSHFDFPVPDELAPPMLTLEDVSAGYEDNVVLKKLNFSIVNNDRIALLGANGNGKSTLAKLISGRLQPLSGNIHASKKLKVGYFAQYQAEELPFDLTPTQHLLHLMPEKNETKVRSHLARFGLDKEKAETVIAKLSGGEKARLLFAVMTRTAPALLILDEPTNHLDVEGREALIEALNDYTGSVILITHDLHLIELIADDLWLVKNHACKPYDGDLEDYKKSLLTGKNTAKKKQEEVQKPTVVKTNNYQENKQLTTEIKRLEKNLDKLHQEKTEMEAKFAVEQTAENLVKLQRDFSYLQNQISETEAAWLSATGKLENL